VAPDKVAFTSRRLREQRVSGEERRPGDDTSEFMAIRSP